MRRMRWWAALTALVLSSQLVLVSTSASLRGTTANAGNGWTADQLQAPSGLTVVPGATCVMNLSWTAAPSTWASGYKIYRTANPSTNPYSLLATVDGQPTTSYADSGGSLKFGLRFHYVVRAYRGAWLSAESNSADALAPAACL